MATACERLDEMVKEYLLFRGFTTTAKSLDYEIKHDKDRGLRADKIVEQLTAYVGSHDLQHLREYWAYLNQRFFSRLEQRYAVSVRKLEVGLLKLYVVNAHQSNRQDRVRDFFEKIGAELQNQLEFRDWFVFPFLGSPTENGTFALYFTRQWQETLQLSLYNFLQVVLQAMPVPALMNFDHDTRRILALQEENDSLKIQIQTNAAIEKKAFRAKPTQQSPAPQPLPDLIYDFSGLADGNPAQSTETGNERQQKTSRRFPINLPTPLLKRNKQPDPRQDARQDATTTSQQGTPHPHSNQSANNSSTESFTHQQPQPHSTPPGPVGGGSTMATAPAGIGGAPSGHRPSVIRSSSEPQGVITHPGQGEVSTGPASRKKGPRELTSFPPYTSPMAEKSDPVPVKTSSLASAERPQGQGQGERATTLTEASGQEEKVTRERRSSSGPLEYGPVESLQPIAEGKQCPFLILSDDEYLEHQSAVCYSRFSLSGQHVASLDADGIVKIWTWSPQPCTTATVMSRAPFLSLDWASKSDRWLLLGNQSGQIRLFDTREIKTFREASVDAANMKVTYLSTCPSTMTFASCLSSADPGSQAGKLALWDLKTMKMERYLPLDAQPVSVTCCVYSSNGKLLLAAGVDGTVRLYDIGVRQCVKTWRVSKTALQTVQFAHHDASFLTMGPEGLLSEWSLSQTARPVRLVGLKEGAAASLSQAAPASGSETAVSGQLFSLNKDKTFLLCSMQRHGVLCKVGDGQTKTMQKMVELSGHTDVVTTVDWSPCVDTPVCLTGARDGHLKVATLLSQ